MKARYVPQRSYSDYDLNDMIHMPGTLTVHEEERSPQRTGLLNAMGEPLMRLPETIKLGFHKS